MKLNKTFNSEFKIVSEIVIVLEFTFGRYKNCELFYDGVGL